MAGASKNNHTRLPNPYLNRLPTRSAIPDGRLIPQTVDRTQLFLDGRADGIPFPITHLDQQHARIRAILSLPSEFVLHSLRHTFGTRLGEAGADAFTIMRLMGHSSVTVSQRYVHPSPEAVELAFSRLERINQAQDAASQAGVGTKLGTAPRERAELIQ